MKNRYASTHNISSQDSKLRNRRRIKGRLVKEKCKMISMLQNVNAQADYPWIVRMAHFQFKKVWKASLAKRHKKRMQKIMNAPEKPHLLQLQAVSYDGEAIFEGTLLDYPPWREATFFRATREQHARRCLGYARWATTKLALTCMINYKIIHELMYQKYVKTWTRNVCQTAGFNVKKHQDIVES